MKTPLNIQDLDKNIQNLSQALRKKVQEKTTATKSDVLSEKYAARLALDAARIARNLPQESASTARKKKARLLGSLRPVLRRVEGLLLADLGKDVWQEVRVRPFQIPYVVYAQKTWDLFLLTVSPKTVQLLLEVVEFSQNDIYEQLRQLAYYTHFLENPLDLRKEWGQLSAIRDILENMLRLIDE